MKNWNCSKGFAHNRNLGLLLLRIGIGAVMLVHGIQKLENMNGTIMFFHHLGFSAFWAWLVTAVETLGGAMLILGLWTQIAACAIAIEMLFIILFLDAGKAFPSYNLEFVVLISTLSIALMGSGRHSLSKKCSSCKECDCMCHSGDGRCGDGICKGCGCK